MDQVKIGEFLKELRKEKELTQEQLAERFNVSRRSVSRWETGNSMPDLAILNARFGILTMIFKSPIDEFAERALTCIGIGFGIAGFMFDSRDAKQTRNWLGLMKQEMLMRHK